MFQPAVTNRIEKGHGHGHVTNIKILHGTRP